MKNCVRRHNALYSLEHQSKRAAHGTRELTRKIRETKTVRLLKSLLFVIPSEVEESLVIKIVIP